MWAVSAGVKLSYAQAADGSTPVVFHARDVVPTPEAVADAVVTSRGAGSPPLAWVEWNGERVVLTSTAEDEGERLLVLLRTLPADARVTFEALSAAAGLSASTVRRRLRPLGIVSLDDLARMRGVTPAPPESEALPRHPPRAEKGSLTPYAPTECVTSRRITPLGRTDRPRGSALTDLAKKRA